MTATIHLLVIVHGMWGHIGHVAELNRIVKETYAEPAEDGSRLEVLCAETNQEESTYDGIDWGGERVAKEVLEKVEELEKSGDQVKKLSVTGYSLGGLLSRYVVGILHQQGFFEKVTPVNFNTIATPHLGLPRYRSIFSSLASTLGPRLLSRTGEQFYCVDKWSPKGRPLLVVMADPERVFYQALTKFKHVRIYANAVNDVTVPYVTAAIELEDPFAEHQTNGIDITMSDDYKHVITGYSLPDIPPPQPEQPKMLSREWFSSRKPRRPFLPPALQLRWPLNYVLYAMLPVLVPTFISIAIVKLSLASHSSRARIKLLEAEHTASSEQQRLIHILAELEHGIEDAVADLVTDEDDPGTMTPTSSKKLAIIKAQAHPILNAHQKKIAGWLNTLPGLKKELAFFPDVRNAHAMIISRDVKRFEAHRLGEDVIRHWADHLVV